MPPITTTSDLQLLRPGDRLQYRGIEWRVADYSTYADPGGYATEEWLLKLTDNKEYYLMREVDPQNPASLVNWYLAEELIKPKITLPDSADNLSDRLWQDMQNQQLPYPELQMFGKTYYFESNTQGDYEEGGENDEQTARITWDYWDAAHQWNTALEAWPDGKLRVYATKVVKPEEFSQVRKSTPKSSYSWLGILRISLAAAGLLLILVGCGMFIFG
jgi:hypothetical protein